MNTTKVFLLGAAAGIIGVVVVTQIAGLLGAEFMYTAGEKAGKVEEKFVKQMEDED